MIINKNLGISGSGGRRGRGPGARIDSGSIRTSADPICSRTGIDTDPRTSAIDTSTGIHTGSRIHATVDARGSSIGAVAHVTVSTAIVRGGGITSRVAARVPDITSGIATCITASVVGRITASVTGHVIAGITSAVVARIMAAPIAATAAATAGAAAASGFGFGGHHGDACQSGTDASESHQSTRHV